MNRARFGGFTLIEVMVALAVVAVALPALMVALYQQIDGTAYLRDKSLAHMVAANKLTEIRIVAESTRSLPLGRESGLQEMAGREWYWWLESSETEVPDFHRLEIKVAGAEENEDEPLITLAAFLSSDLDVAVDSGGGSGQRDDPGPDKTPAQDDKSQENEAPEPKNKEG
ncbi:MAG: type II secretion system minor pseudopilin GspI [Halioglobus sp.]